MSQEEYAIELLKLRDSIKYLRNEYVDKYNNAVTDGLNAFTENRIFQTKEHHGKSVAYDEILKDLEELLK